jgi:hypothetical protein
LLAWNKVWIESAIPTFALKLTCKDIYAYAGFEQAHSVKRSAIKAILTKLTLSEAHSSI